MTLNPNPACARPAFLLGVSLLFTHELDAMTYAEWQVLSLTSRLRAQRSQYWLSLFLLAHGGLHFAFSIHLENDGLVAVNEDAMLQVPAHRPRQYA